MQSLLLREMLADTLERADARLHPLIEMVYDHAPSAPKMMSRTERLAFLSILALRDRVQAQRRLVESDLRPLFEPDPLVDAVLKDTISALSMQAAENHDMALIDDLVAIQKTHALVQRRSKQ